MNSVSVLIPTLNAGSTLAPLLDSLKEQTVEADEIVVVDSESTDGTVDIASDYGCKIVGVSREAFGHGETRTLAARNASGNCLVYLTQDVMPSRKHTVESLIVSLKDERVGAAFGRQVAGDSDSIFARHSRHFNYPDRSFRRRSQDRKVIGLRTVFFSNSFAAYRRSALERINYFQNGVIFGEDTCAAARMISEGYEIVYAADAGVFHSHNYTVCQDFKRYFDMGVLHRSEAWLLREFGRAENQGLKYVKSEFRFLLKERAFDLLPEFVLRNAMRFMGYGFGRNYTRIPDSMSKRFSMNKMWWGKRAH